jgi:hypothetical protein
LYPILRAYTRKQGVNRLKRSVTTKLQPESGKGLPKNEIPALGFLRQLSGTLRSLLLDPLAGIPWACDTNHFNF